MITTREYRELLARYAKVCEQLERLRGDGAYWIALITAKELWNEVAEQTNLRTIARLARCRRLGMQS